MSCRGVLSREPGEAASGAGSHDRCEIERLQTSPRRLRGRPEVERGRRVKASQLQAAGPVGTAASETQTEPELPGCLRAKSLSSRVDNQPPWKARGQMLLRSGELHPHRPCLSGKRRRSRGWGHLPGDRSHCRAGSFPWSLPAPPWLTLRPRVLRIARTTRTRLFQKIDLATKGVSTF